MIKNVRRLLLAVMVLTAICFCLTLNVSKTVNAASVTIGGESFTITEDDYFVRSTAIRLDDGGEQNGVRFKTVIKKDLYQRIASAKTVSDEVVYGLLLIPAYRVAEGEELTVSTQNVTNKTIDDVFKNVVYNVNGEDVIYKEGVIYVYDIPRSHLTDDIMVRSYLKVNGSVVYYSQTKQISMAEVAYKEVEALNDGTSPLPTQSKDKDYYIDYITENYLTYYAKCYCDGEEIGQATIKYNKSIDVPDFTKKGHTFQGLYTDSGKTVEFDSSNVDLKGGDFNIYADFSKNYYKLKVNYLPATSDGLDHFIEVKDDVVSEKTVASYEQNVLFGESYNVNNPVVDGYSTVQTTVSGDMDDEGKEITVYYTRNTYNFTVTHQNANGVFKTENKTVKYGESLAGLYSQETVSSIIGVSATDVNNYMSSSDSAISYTYTLKSDASSYLGEGDKVESMAIFNTNDDVSIKYTHTGSSIEFARIFKIGDVLLTNSVIIVYNSATATEDADRKYRLNIGDVDGNYEVKSLVPGNNVYNYELVFRGSTGDIEWYRDGIRIFSVSSSTSCKGLNGSEDTTVATLTRHIIEQINECGIEVLYGVYKNDDGTLSNVSVRLTPASSEANVNYIVTGDLAHPNDISYTILSDYDIYLELKMPGYKYTVSNGAVLNDKLKLEGGTYTVSYVRPAEASRNIVFSKTGIDNHIVRIGKNLNSTSYAYGLDELQGNFYLEFHLQDIFMMMSDYSSNEQSVTRRTPIVQIADGSNYSRWRRFFLDNHVETSSGFPLGDITTSNDWWGNGNFSDLHNKRLSCYIKVIRQNSLIQLTYYVTVEGGENYSFNYRIENVDSDKINVSLDTYDCAYRIDWCQIEDSTVYNSTNELPEKTVFEAGNAGYYNRIGVNKNCYGTNYAWNNWGDSDHVNICGFNNGVSTGTDDFDWSFSYYSWGCDGLNSSCSWNEAKSTAPMLFMLQATTPADTTKAGLNKVNVYKTYYKTFVTCHYDGGTAVGENWFVDGGGITSTAWENASTGATFDYSKYSACDIYFRAYVYYRIKRVGGTVTVTQIYVPLALNRDTSTDTAIYNNDQTQFTRTITFTNVYTDRDSSKGKADLYICIAALHGGIEWSGAWNELQDQS